MATDDGPHSAAPRSRAAPPSGKQFRLESGDQTAVVTEVGAGLRSYTVDGRELLDGYDADQMCTGARGQTFIPWPNRIAGGAYSFEGADHQLPLTEPTANNALHGLTRWSQWHLVQDTQQSMRLQHVLHPQPGYPFALRCEIAYRLTGTGLSVTTRVTNIGAGPCPYATGAHPYLRLGAGTVDELSVEVPAASYYPTDARGIPTGRTAVDDTDYDLRVPVQLGSRILDTAFTDFSDTAGSGTTVRVRDLDGAELELWMDPAYRYVQVFTGDSLPESSRRRRGLAVEPMTAAPNAFRSGDGLLTLQPGEHHQGTWELRPGTH